MSVDDIAMLFSTNEHLDLLNRVRENTNTQKVATEDLEQVLLHCSKDSSPRKLLDIQEVNSLLKSLNSQMSQVEQKLNNFIIQSRRNQKDAQFILMEQATSGLNLTKALQNIITMKESDMTQFLEKK